MSQTATTSQSLCVEEGGEHLIAAIAQADEADADAVVGAVDPRGAEGGEARGTDGRGFGEVAAGDPAHALAPLSHTTYRDDTPARDQFHPPTGERAERGHFSVVKFG